MRILFCLLAAANALAQSGPYIDLRGDWRKSADDRSGYASEKADDSAWRRVQLPWTKAPPPGAYWLRRSVDLPPGANRGRIAITLGPVRELYELYVNGVRVGSTGAFTEEAAQIARQRTFRVPATAIPGNHLELAIRTRGVSGHRPAMWSIYLGGRYLITDVEQAPEDTGDFLIMERQLRRMPGFVLLALNLFVAILVLLLWLVERDRRELLWLGLFLFASGSAMGLAYFMISPDTFPWRPPNWAGITNALTGVTLAELVMATYGVRSFALRASLWALWLLVPEIQATDLVVPMSAVTAGIAAFGWWRQGGVRQTFEKHLVAVALLLMVVTLANRGAGKALPGLPGIFHAGGYEWTTQGVTVTVLTTILAIMLIRRLAADRQEKQRLASEIQAARVVQQFLLTGESPADTEYVTEAVYSPAEVVGGDFYQVLPILGGGVLAVVGDVSGKGLKAAMVVSMMTGVIRAHSLLPPGALLAQMNRVLGAGSKGFVTCAAIRFEPGGEVVIANAGHLAPYRDGDEYEAIESGLPLGIASDFPYAETRLKLRSGGCLTVVTDGVVEASNAKGDLFGFNRTRSISGKSAGEIAVAAKAWGQNDDITVVTVRRKA